MKGLKSNDWKPDSTIISQKTSSFSRYNVNTKRKDKFHKSQTVQVKKSRPSIQSNRFTNIHQLLSNSSEVMEDISLSSLIFDFSKDPVEVKIFDQTSGTYELLVSNESLKEFKMKVILGEDKRSKSNFTILLGDCQCYPELPEGSAFPDETCSMSSSLENSSLNFGLSHNLTPSMSERCVSVDDGTGSKGEYDSFANKERHGKQKPEPHDDNFETTNRKKTEPTLAIKFGNKNGWGDVLCLGETVDLKKENKRKTSDVKRKHSQSGNEDALKLLLKRPTSHLKTERDLSKESGSTSIYKSNLEEFIRFLMNDTVSTTVLGSMSSVRNSGEKSKNEKNLENSSDQTYKNSSGNGSANLNQSKEEQNEINENFQTSQPFSVEKLENALVDEIDTVFDCFEFESSIKLNDKNEEGDSERLLVESDTGTDKLVAENTALDTNCSNSLIESGCVPMYDSISEEPDTVRKLEEDFVDAKSNCDALSICDSFEEFLLGVKNDAADAIKSSDAFSVTEGDGSLHTDVFKETLPEWLCERESLSTEPPLYIPPIPLESVSPTDVESMWAEFVKIFLPNPKLFQMTPCKSCYPSTTEGLKFMAGAIPTKSNPTPGTITTNNVFPELENMPSFFEYLNRTMISFIQNSRTTMSMEASFRERREFENIPSKPQEIERQTSAIVREMIESSQVPSLARLMSPDLLNNMSAVHARDSSFSEDLSRKISSNYNPSHPKSRHGKIFFNPTVSNTKYT